MGTCEHAQMDFSTPMNTHRDTQYINGYASSLANTSFFIQIFLQIQFKIVFLRLFSQSLVLSH